ncbi:unnamed protein product [Tilletia caries]|uniref:Knr4/Smi1-like domain-containing protein n=3 Tax=Tilletia caries TaxID=13290 RepID=A0ABN7ILJ6_9BASI|nr:hypothetical protein CF336_g2367 [Tilletia laevis]KAE8206853.1 hypothetical protein CF335_g1569 [Tilletia laevis]CAD6884292.1 unnamed protein product [Tilletia caries]CAD6900040.1 unnamed protein product [Tilletia caries]CAD7062144.1 unnamed protein product [Tilletia caries]
MAPPGILSSFSSWWGTASNPSGSSSGSSYYHGANGGNAKKSPYSSTYSAWSTSPYNERGTGAAANYPPQPRTSFNLARPSASVADFTNMYPTGSTSNLVPSHTGGGGANTPGGAYPYETNPGGPSGSGTPRYSTSTSTRPAISDGSNMMPSNAYPPLRHTWNRIRKWANRNYTELSDTLNWPATEAQIDALEMAIGSALPPAVRESWLCYNGQETESKQSCSDGVFFGLTLLSCERIAEEWQFWRAVDDDPSTGANPDVNAAMASCPDGWIRPVYSSRGWIPLISDNAGNYIGVDLFPHPSGAGSPGQVIAFGRDLDTKVVLWRGDGEGGWGRFLQSFAEELEAAECYSLGGDGDAGSSGEEEDSIGYESYFSNAGGGATKGGGDRGGDGAAGFRLTGEYKGWPVVEAWADRSIRFWQTVGLQPGMPNGGPEARQRYLEQTEGTNGMANPGVRMAEVNDEEDEAYAAARDQITGDAAAAAAAAGHSLPAASSSSSSIASQQELSSGSGTSGANAPSSSLAAGQTHPLEDTPAGDEDTPVGRQSESADEPDGGNGNGAGPTAAAAAAGSSGPVPLIYTDDTGVSEPQPESDADLNGTSAASASAASRNPGDTLSPPMPTSKGWRSKQKQRETDSGGGGGGGGAGGSRSASTTSARRRSPPVPAGPIDLPTWEEVLSEQAAVLAEDGGPPMDVNEYAGCRRSTNLLSNSGGGGGGVSALLPTSLGGVNVLGRVLGGGDARRTSGGGGNHRSSLGGGGGAGFWDGAQSPVHRDSLGSPRRSAEEGGHGMDANGGKRSSWSLASAAAAGLGVLGTTLSGQRSPRQSFGGVGHGPEGSSGSNGSGGRGGGGLNSVRVVRRDDAVELNDRGSADDMSSSGRPLFGTDGTLGGGGSSRKSSRLTSNKAQPPLPGSNSNNSQDDTSVGVDPLVESTLAASAAATGRRDLSHRSPLHSPNLRGQFDSDVFTPADQPQHRPRLNGGGGRPSDVSENGAPSSSLIARADGASQERSGGEGGLLIDAPNSPLVDQAPVFGVTKVDS